MSQRRVPKQERIQARIWITQHACIQTIIVTDLTHNPRKKCITHEKRTGAWERARAWVATKIETMHKGSTDTNATRCEVWFWVNAFCYELTLQPNIGALFKVNKGVARHNFIHESHIKVGWSPNRNSINSFSLHPPATVHIKQVIFCSCLIIQYNINIEGSY